MNLRLLLPLLFISLFSMSATSVKIQPSVISSSHPTVTEVTSVTTSVKKSKLNFVEKLLLKYVLKKFKKAEDTAKADRQAKTALSFGIAAMAFLLLGLVVPVVIFGTLPLGIIAMATGSSALKGGTTEEGKARTGKSLGLGALIAFGVLLLAAVILVASFAGWGG
jgi:hypothetical protein